jgi:hypothetical protein
VARRVSWTRRAGAGDEGQSIAGRGQPGPVDERQSITRAEGQSIPRAEGQSIPRTEGQSIARGEGQRYARASYCYTQVQADSDANCDD